MNNKLKNTLIVLAGIVLLKLETNIDSLAMLLVLESWITLPKITLPKSSFIFWYLYAKESKVKEASW